MDLDNTTRVYKEYYDNGELKSEVFMCNGKKEGLYISYQKNGLLYEEINYINDKKEGLSKLFFDNGNIFIEINYKNNKKFGTETVYYENGNIKSTIEYENNYELKHGKQKDYDENNDLIKETEWFLGKRQSQCKIYNNNKLSEIYTYVSGTYDGPYKKFHPNGKIAIEGMYNHHSRYGTFNYYNENGDLILQEEYDFITGKKIIFKI